MLRVYVTATGLGAASNGIVATPPQKASGLAAVGASHCAFKVDRPKNSEILNSSNFFIYLNIKICNLANV
jgi:hypothetical protein